MEALEPVISAQTLSFHHGKHLQAYVDNLNKLLPGSEYEGMTLEEIVRKAPAGRLSIGVLSVIGMMPNCDSAVKVG